MFNGFRPEAGSTETHITLEEAVAQVKTYQLIEGKVKKTHAWSWLTEHTHEACSWLRAYSHELVNNLSIFLTANPASLL